MSAYEEKTTKVTIEVTVEIETCAGCGDTCTLIPLDIQADRAFSDGQTRTPQAYLVKGGWLPAGWATFSRSGRDETMRGYHKEILLCPTCAPICVRVIENLIVEIKSGSL